MRLAIAILAMTTFMSIPTDAAETTDALRPPAAAKKPKVTKIHGETLTDNYFWLREKTNPEVIQYLEKENAYTAAVLKPTEPLQQQLYDEMLGHVKQTDVNVPYRIGDYYYYTRTVEGQQYPIFARKRGSLDAPEEVLLEQNEMAKGLKYFSVGITRVSDDGNLLAYTTDTTGYRQYTLHVKDLRTGQLLSDTAERVDSVDWATDNKTLFFVTEDPVNKRSNKFFRHTLGSEAFDLLYEEPDELFDIGSYRTRDRAFVVVHAESKLTSEARYLPADSPTAALRVLEPREKNHKYYVEHRGDLFYIRTNTNGAKNYRLVTAPDSDAQRKNWTELIAARPEVKIDDFELFANHLVLEELQGGSQTIRVYDFRTKEWAPLKFEEPVYSITSDNNPEFNTNVLRYAYTSLVTPGSIFDYDMDAKTSKLMKRTEVLSYDPSLYTQERVYATATDGTKIPVSLVYRKDLKRDGKRPMLLYAYGSYGIPQWPAFRSSRLPLLDRGVIFALAHIRGGGELGEPWREAGRMMEKKNTFTDFINVAEYLVREKYTSSDRLAIEGRSAGGLLMGAVTNMRPDLFKVVLAGVPFVDVINTMLDASLPLTTAEYEEWGNPNVAADYAYMKSYSPYDNVRAQKYPAMLVETSLNDSQVPYWEGAKLVAKIRSVNQGKSPILLRTNMGAGHGGASGRYDALRESAVRYAFMLSEIVPSEAPRKMMKKE